MDALILVDLQNDFCPGGALEVAEGDQVIPIANALMPKFGLVVATQDWHPADHMSFAANHPLRRPGQVIQLNGSPQVLWPIHCVQESYGAEFKDSLNKEDIHKIVQKGTDKEIDSYSGFFDNGRLKATELADYLRAQQVKRVFVMGLATDYCVKYTALDALSLGWETYLVEDGCRGVNLNAGDVDKAVEEMEAKGVEIIHSKKINKFL